MRDAERREFGMRANAKAAARLAAPRIIGGVGKASRYQDAERRYQEQRSQLLNDQNSPR